MARRKRKWNKQIYDKYLAIGKGQGELSSYKPWIEVRDFPSVGMSNRVYGVTTGRVHHFLSSLELAYFYILEWSDKILDIREQYPILDLSSVIKIADKAGIRYPFDKVSGFPYVLTSDFFIVTTTGFCVRSVKRRKNLENQRTREKLEIERRYWEEKGVDWKIVTEEQINFKKARNIEWILSSYDLPSTFVSDSTLEDCLEYFEYLFNNTRLSIIDVANEVVDRLQ